MRSLVLALSLCATALVSAQNMPHPPVRFPIRHADPWAVKALLEGSSIPYPELSTMMAFGGMLPIGPAMQALITGGHFVVNATDNSLWFFFDQKPK